MNYLAPKALPPELSGTLEELHRLNPIAGAVFERIALRLYCCGHVDGFREGAEGVAKEVLGSLDAKLAELKAGPRG